MDTFTGAFAKARRGACTVLCLALLFSPATQSVDRQWVQIEGVSDAALLAELRAASALARMEDTSTFTDLWLQKKAEMECADLVAVLRAAGFHDAKIAATVLTEQAQRYVLFTVETGDQYVFDAPTLSFLPEIDPGLGRDIREQLPVKAGAPAQSQKIIDAEKGVLSKLRSAAHPFAMIADRKVVVDRSERTVHADLMVNPGDACRFGPAKIEGLEQVAENVVLAELPWKPGTPCTQELLDKARARLLKTNLFSVVDMQPQPSTTPGEAIVCIRVVERKPRSIALGLQYRTDEGPGVSALWEHRNLGGLGNRLRLQGEFSGIEQGFSALYEMPRFRHPDQILSLGLKASNETPDAYDSRSTDATLWLERHFGETFTVGGGASLRYSRVKQQDDFENYLLGSIPLQVLIDTRNDLLNPTSGIRAAFREEPYMDFAGSDALFLKSDWTVTGMHAFGPNDDWVLAGRLRLGTIAGEALDKVPADIRFYAGGGGSIRGFAYQKAGTLDCDEDPVGGRSLAEWTVELRKRITERIGIAAFVDGGAAFADPFPDFSERLFWGGGIGLRYFTPVGPIRFDIATPLNPRGGVDSSLQFYISVGQAF